MILYQDTNQNIFTTQCYSEDEQLQVLDWPCSIPPYAIEADDLVAAVPADMSLQDLDRDLLGYGLTTAISGLPCKSISELLSESHDFGQQVLGLYLKHIDGRESKCGGKVIKNVSGYDMAKLYLGSCNSFAIISFAYLRLIKLPEYRIQFTCNFDFKEDVVLELLKLHESMDISIHNGMLHLSLNTDHKLLELQSTKLTNKLSDLLKQEIKLDLKVFQKDYGPNNIGATIKTSLTSLLELYTHLSKKINPEKIIFKIKQNQIIILGQDYTLDHCLELKQIKDFCLQIWPVTRKNKIIERMINSQNNHELKLIEQIKNFYDPEQKLNPGILCETSI
jgi:hypothetical protein